MAAFIIHNIICMCCTCLLLFLNATQRTPCMPRRSSRKGQHMQLSKRVDESRHSCSLFIHDLLLLMLHLFAASFCLKAERSSKKAAEDCAGKQNFFCLVVCFYVCFTIDKAAVLAVCAIYALAPFVLSLTTGKAAVPGVSCLCL